MRELPTDSFAFQARIMDALIGDIQDRSASGFPRLDALREVSNQSKGRECSLKSGSRADQ